MEKPQYLFWIFLIFAVQPGFHCTEVEDLDDIFKDEDCVEGNFLLDDANPVLIRTNYNTKVGEPVKQATTTDTHLLVDFKKEVEEHKNALNRVNEVAQINKIGVEYLLVSEEGMPHDRTFVIRLDLGEETYWGTAKSIKTAKRNAATEALLKTKYTRPKESVKTVKEVEKLTPTVQLNNIAAKLGLKVDYIKANGEHILDKDLLDDDISSHNYIMLDQTSKNLMSKFNESVKEMNKSSALKIAPADHENKSPFTISLQVGTQVFSGSGWTIQAARHDAANNALEHFKKMSMKDAEQCLKEGEECNKLAVKSPISLVYEIATKRSLTVTFEITGESGLSHKKEFVTTCRVGDTTTEGEGSSKKASKKKAAEKMLLELGKVEAIDVGSTIRVNTENLSKKKKKKKKTKRNKVAKGNINNLKANIADTVSSVYNYFAGNEDDNPGNSKQDSYKQELLKLGKDIGMTIQFSTFPNGDEFSTVVHLNTDPSYVCYNKDASKDSSVENAALNALKFIKQIGFDNIIIPLKYTKEGKPKIVLDKKTSNAGITKQR